MKNAMMEIQFQVMDVPATVRLSAGIIATRSRPEIHARCRVEMVSKRVEKNAMMEILRMVMVVHKCVQLRLALIVYP